MYKKSRRATDKTGLAWGGCTEPMCFMEIYTAIQQNPVSESISKHFSPLHGGLCLNNGGQFFGLQRRQIHHLHMMARVTFPHALPCWSNKLDAIASHPYYTFFTDTVEFKPSTLCALSRHSWQNNFWIWRQFLRGSNPLHRARKQNVYWIWNNLNMANPRIDSD